MKKYRNKVKGPLSIGLKTGSISVAYKGYFEVDGEDMISPDLLTKEREGKIELIEQISDRGIKPEIESAIEVSAEKLYMDVINVRKLESVDTETVEAKEDKKDNDSLTNRPEMVEMKDEDNDLESNIERIDSGDANFKKKSKRERKAFRDRNPGV